MSRRWSVVIPALKKRHAVLLDEIDEAVLLCDASGPASRKDVLEGLRLSRP